MRQKKIIFIQWNKDGKVEAFSKLTTLCEAYDQFNYDTLQYWLSRKNEPYKSDECTITKIDLK